MNKLIGLSILFLMGCGTGDSSTFGNLGIVGDTVTSVGSGGTGGFGGSASSAGGGGSSSVSSSNNSTVTSTGNASSSSSSVTGSGGGMCQSKSCLTQGFNCGIVDDACGNNINCGSCDTSMNAFNVCGDAKPPAMGKPNVCGGGCSGSASGACNGAFCKDGFTACVHATLCSIVNFNMPPDPNCSFGGGNIWCCSKAINFGM